MRGSRRCWWIYPVWLLFAASLAGSVLAVAADVLAEAEAAVRKAERAVKRAEDQRALWTSAQDALRKARRALNEGNSATALEQAGIAEKQSELGIAQKSYPLFHER